MQRLLAIAKLTLKAAFRYRLVQILIVLLLGAVVGLPAISVPCGFTRSGLPIGLQIVGPLYAEDRVLRAARAFEQTQPERRPPLD